MASEEPDEPLAGSGVLIVATLALLWLFWMLRSSEPPFEAWAVVALLWVCGTAIMLAEKGGVR